MIFEPNTCSLLEGKVGEQVFGSNITITDEPQFDSSFFRVSFDDEGVAANPTTIVENGKLISYLSNLKTAKILNAGRASIYRAIENLEKLSLIKFENKKIYISDREGLERITK